MTVTVLAEGIDDLQQFVDLIPRAAVTAARIAVNDVTRKVAVKESIAEMGRQVAFPPGYLADPKRLRISKFATENDLESIVTARQRPTSLARFSSGSVGKAGVQVRVNTGASRRIDRAFLVRLPQGRGPVTDEAFNLGLAIRLRPGERITGKRDMVATPLGKGGLYLLYGPSVDQVFRTVAQEVSPRIAQELAVEFVRQFARISGGGRA